MSSVSGRSIRRTSRTVRGTTSIPTTSRQARNAPSFTTVPPRAPGETVAPAATAVRTARIMMATRSSTMRIPTTRSRSRPRTPSSSNAFATMVVEEIATMAPTNTLCRTVHPNARPTTNPSHSIALDSTMAAMPAVEATATSFWTRNSSPSENISRMTPSSDRVWTMVRSATRGTGTCGPTMRPARR
jgi:hypothetical protein